MGAVAMKVTIREHYTGPLPVVTATMHREDGTILSHVSVTDQEWTTVRRLLGRQSLDGLVIEIPDHWSP
jgi:hypothetical protein